MIYLDTCLVIYWVENHSVFAPQISQRIIASSEQSFAISPLVITEALVMPYRKQNKALTSKFEAFFASCQMLLLPEEIFYQAARLRANHIGLKTPDTLHLATAQHHQCEHFWTNDDRLQRIADRYAVNIL